MITLFDLVGLVGVAAYVTAYAQLQLGRMSSDNTGYLALNALGALLLLVSLFANFNLSSFVTQVLWLGFTIFGFLRARRPGRRA
ncbi:CBU_0592 family membrane protein [Novosphingobium terrae]|uniref:CBU_0592 family membrane protein n=1 Tax=Novosphingobium terrae TaxID=2726189 RepID=UPI001F12E4C5|nr:hypothetical protein [Novosphingobium terrae]